VLGHINTMLIITVIDKRGQELIVESARLHHHHHDTSMDASSYIEGSIYHP